MNDLIGMFALSFIGLGFFAGIFSLFISHSISLWWRSFIFITYIPIILFTLLISGF